jgi:hypothetical protein
MGNSTVTPVEMNGKTYYLAFTLNVMEALQSRYENINVLFEELSKAEKDPMSIDMKMVIDFFEEMLIEGSDIQSENTGEAITPPTHRQAGRIIQAVGLGKSAAIFRDLVVKSTDTGEASKNA